jgi:hypothetical protein
MNDNKILNKFFSTVIMMEQSWILTCGLLLAVN